LSGIDIIGDVHGHADALKALLRKLGYREQRGAWRHPSRRVIFLGDFVDRGRQQRETLQIAHAMYEAGTAEAVMGNHEYNAITFGMPDPRADGEYLRPRDDKNRNQHQRFLDEVGEDSAEHHAWLQWFRELPLWIERDGLRVVHACWHEERQRDLEPLLDARRCLTEAGIEASAREPSAEHEAVETLLKGLETDLPEGVSFRDKDGYPRTRIRTRWWANGPLSYAEAALLPSGVEAELPQTRDPANTVPATALPGYTAPQPVFIGHYWLQGEPEPMSDRVACVDYSVALGGKLCAYQWDGESVLDASKFRWVQHDATA